MKNNFFSNNRNRVILTVVLLVLIAVIIGVLIKINIDNKTSDTSSNSKYNSTTLDTENVMIGSNSENAVSITNSSIGEYNNTIVENNGSSNGQNSNNDNSNVGNGSNNYSTPSGEESSNPSESNDKYLITLTPIDLGEYGILQYTVTITKNDTEFKDYKGVDYNGKQYRLAGDAKTFPATNVNKSINQAVITLNDESKVTAEVVYK